MLLAWNSSLACLEVQVLPIYLLPSQPGMRGNMSRLSETFLPVQSGMLGTVGHLPQFLVLETCPQSFSGWISPLL